MSDPDDRKVPNPRPRGMRTWSAREHEGVRGMDSPMSQPVDGGSPEPIPDEVLRELAAAPGPQAVRPDEAVDVINTLAAHRLSLARELLAARETIAILLPYAENARAGAVCERALALLPEGSSDA